jgi:hypothetical protein
VQILVYIYSSFGINEKYRNKLKLPVILCGFVLRVDLKHKIFSFCFKRK